MVFGSSSAFFQGCECFVWAAVGQQRCAQYWQLIDRIIQQIVLQTKEGDPDVSPLELDVKKLVKQYVFYFTSINHDCFVV